MRVVFLTATLVLAAIYIALYLSLSKEVEVLRRSSRAFCTDADEILYMNLFEQCKRYRKLTEHPLPVTVFVTMVTAPLEWMRNAAK